MTPWFTRSSLFSTPARHCGGSLAACASVARLCVAFSSRSSTLVRLEQSTDYREPYHDGRVNWTRMKEGNWYAVSKWYRRASGILESSVILDGFGRSKLGAFQFPSAPATSGEPIAHVPVPSRGMPGRVDVAAARPARPSAGEYGRSTLRAEVAARPGNHQPPPPVKKRRKNRSCSEWELMLWQLNMRPSDQRLSMMSI
jgi:hypothetical protein